MPPISANPKQGPRVGGFFYLFNDNPHPNGPIHVESRIMKNVMSSAAEAETGALFHNGQEGAYFRQILLELGHPLMIRMWDSPVPSCTRILDPVISSSSRLVVVVDSKLTISQVTLSIIRLDYGRTPTRPSRTSDSFLNKRRRLQTYRAVEPIALVSFLTANDDELDRLHQGSSSYRHRSSTPHVDSYQRRPTPSTYTVDQHR